MFGDVFGKCLAGTGRARTGRSERAREPAGNTAARPTVSRRREERFRVEWKGYSMKEVSRRNFVKLSAATAGLGLTAGALAGCSGEGGGSGSGAADGDIMIGVSIWSSTDALGSLSKNILDKAAGILGVKLNYVDQGHVSEQVTASIETLCAAGCQGIIVCNSADSEMQACISESAELQTMMPWQPAAHRVSMEAVTCSETWPWST